MQMPQKGVRYQKIWIINPVTLGLKSTIALK